MGSSTPLVGRINELELLRRAAVDARAGTPSAVLVHGEPGVGKTRLLTEVAAELGAQDFQLLWGRCVRFAAEASSYLPIAQALGSRLELGGSTTDGGIVLHRVGAAVGELLESRPVALVVDDLQWSDLSSLDVLTYLVAGFARGQRLLLLGSYRDTELGTGHPLHGWLADIRRMPGVSLLRLGRLDRHETEAVVDALLGRGRHAALAAQTFERSLGNAYLTELLLRDRQPGVDELPSELPGDLREVLLASWHRLAAPTRELLQVLAVGGLPVDVRALQEVAGAVGVDADKVAAGLAEATDAGLVVVEPDGSVWFHHPLVAEVLGSTLLPPEATRLHAVYVAVWLAADSAPGRVRAAHLALHYEAAGDVSAALTWSLRAAVEAEVVRGYGEESNHLARACHLWPGADEIAQAEAGEYIGLLLRAIRAAHRAGDFDSALSLGKQAYTLTAERNDPLTRCRILHDLMWLHQHHLLDWPRAALQEAVELSSAHPTSPEYAQALADLSWFEQWHGLPDAKKHAAESLAVARASGSDEASAFALLVAANASSDQTDALLLAEEAMTLSRRSGDATLIAYSASVRANCLQTLGRARESGPYLADVYSELMRAGAPHEAGWLGASAANHLLTFGDSRRCRDLLRDALSIRMSAFGARLARLVAAALAARSGHPVTAQQHLDRAEEFAAPRGGGHDNAYIWCALDVLVAQRNYRGVLELAVREVAAVVPYDPDVADQLMAMAAMAVADLMVQDGAQRSLALDRLVEIETLRSAVEPAMFQPRSADDLIPPAYGALYAAHRSRVAGDRGGDPDAWRNAVDACDAAGLRWEAVRARYWEAAALLTQRLDRGAASAALREAFRIATDLGAEALCADIEALALQAHISLVDPEIDAHAAEGVPVLDGLTKRENEVLAHVVAGRTYAEIAQELFISEKTVSAHVSNLLRKTSTTSRIELAALARRHSTSPR